MFRRLLEFLNQRKIGERNKLPQLVGGSEAEEMREKVKRKEKYYFSFPLVPFPPNTHPKWRLDRLLLRKRKWLSVI